jgi:putative transposase
LVSVQQKRSVPIRVEQVIKSDREKLSQGSENTESRRPKGQAKRHKASRSKNQTVPTAPEPIPKNQGGRPAGRKNKNKSAVPLNPELLLLQSWIESLLKQLGRMLPLTYLLLDGHFGNNASLQMARRLNLHLISKLRYDSALYIPYQNPDPDRKCRRIYGDKLDISNMPAQYLKNSAIDGPILTDIYQAQLLHKEFAQPLNVVVLVKTHQSTNARHHVNLFTSDPDLPYDKLINFYSLRFQIEFNFRDAKQFWGLEDFMNVSQTAVTNAANLSFFMVNLSHHLIGTGPEKHSGDSVLDLKAMCRGSKYVAEIIKLLPEKPEPVLLAQIFQRISRLGRIHRLPDCSTLG